MRSIPFVGALALTALFSLAAPAGARADETVTLGRAEAPIVDVTVYAGQALVRRLATYEAKAAGSGKLILAKLPAHIVDDSVRVRSQAGTTLLGSRVIARPVGESSLPAVQALTDEIEALDKEKRRLGDDRSLHDATIEQVRAIQAAHASEQGQWLKAGPAELTALVDWSRTTLGAAVEARRKLDEALGALAQKRTLTEMRRVELKGARDIEKDVEVELTAGAPGKFKIEVEYVTGGASWAPFYDLRADMEAKAVDVTYYGIVRQATGEDWQGVKLALSTARPELGARPPDLAMLNVGIQSYYAQSGTSGGAREYDGAPAAAPAPAEASTEPGLAYKTAEKFAEGEVQQAQAQARGATVAFAIPSPETIPSDGKEKRTTIGKGSFKSENRYFSVPKVSPFAYLRSTVKNDFKVPILSGRANVFFGPDFVGKSKVELTPAGEKMDVYLGVDERILVERKTEKRFRDVKGVFTTDVRERYEYRIPVKNSRDVPIQITVIDQVPVSTNEDVRVEDVVWTPEVAKDEKDPKDERWKRTGERKWELTVAAKGEAAVTLGYTVRFPQKKEGAVVGLER